MTRILRPFREVPLDGVLHGSQLASSMRMGTTMLAYGSTG